MTLLLIALYFFLLYKLCLWIKSIKGRRKGTGSRLTDDRRWTITADPTVNLAPDPRIKPLKPLKRKSKPKLLNLQQTIAVLEKHRMTPARPQSKPPKIEQLNKQLNKKLSKLRFYDEDSGYIETEGINYKKERKLS